MPATRRLALITACVAAVHAAVLWALEAGLWRPTRETLIPVSLTDQGETGPIAPSLPGTGAPPLPQRPVLPPAIPAATPAAPPRATPAARTPPAAAPAAVPTDVTVAAAPAVPAAAATAATPTAGPAMAGGASGRVDLPPAGTVGGPAGRIELPSSDADDLQNPKPIYPPPSRRLNEQGKVVVRVLVGVDGLPQQALVHQSSGHDRLDRAAVATVLQWRYRPGKRAGTPEAMWFNVPITFVLE